MFKIPAVDGFVFDANRGAYYVTSDPRIEIEVVRHGHFAPTNFWEVTFNEVSTALIEDRDVVEAAFEAALPLYDALCLIWPADWSVPAPLPART